MDLKVLIDTVDNNCDEKLQCSILYYMPVDREVRNNVDRGEFYWNSVAYIRGINRYRSVHDEFYYHPYDYREPTTDDTVWSGNHEMTKKYINELLNEYHQSNKII